MSKLGDYILKIRNRYSQPQTGHHRYAMNYADTKQVGILFNIQDENSHQALNEMVATLKKDGKQVMALAYFEQEHSNPYNFLFDFFRKKDISSLGKIKSYVVTRFIEHEFDYLYCVNLQTFPPFDYILMNSLAKCRIGKHFIGKESELDLMIDLADTANEADLMRLMLSFTQKLRNN
jgi:hypothetical protein